MVVARGKDDRDDEQHTAGALRRAAIGAAVIGLVLLGSGLTWASAVSRQTDGLAGRTLDTRAAAVGDATEAEYQRYADALGLVAAALGAAPRIDATTFDLSTAPLGSMDLAGATSLAFIAPPVDTEGLASFESTWRSRGSTDLTLAPAEDQRRHVFSVFSKPLDGSSQRRTGIDVSGALAPYAALMEAWRSGGVAVSEAYQLIIDQDLPEDQRQTSFTVAAPVMQGERLAGWVLMGLRGQDFLGTVLERAAENRVDVALWADDPAGNDLTVASLSSRAGGTALHDQQTRSLTLPIAQRTWTLDVSSDTAALIGNIRYRTLAIQVISVIISLLAAGLWWAVVSSHARARADVRTATRDLAVAEAAARRHATLLDATMEAVDEIGVTVVDADGTVLVHSPTARRVLGARGLGDVDDDLEVATPQPDDHGVFTLDGEPFPRGDMPLLRALAGEPTEDVEMVVRNAVYPDGVTIAVSGRPFVLDGRRSGALTVFRDVTEERRQQAEQAAFAGMVAHDLKNPLSLVRGCLEIVTDDLPRLTGPPDAMDATSTYLVKAFTAADRMATLIDDLLDYTSAGDAALEVTDVDLGALVRDTITEVVAGHLAGRRPDGTSRPAPLVHVADLPVARCDPDRMRQVFGNLVGNALKYVHPDDRPVIDVAADRGPDGRGVRLYVADRGIGVPAHLRGDVLKPFVRTPATAGDPASYPGTGLGLAICRRVVERHGGTLRLQPNPGGGTVAVVDLPDAGPNRDPGPGQPNSADALRMVSTRP